MTSEPPESVASSLKTRCRSWMVCVVLIHLHGNRLSVQESHTELLSGRDSRAPYPENINHPKFLRFIHAFFLVLLSSI